jgi:Flp pilus assembly protein TadB
VTDLLLSTRRRVFIGFCIIGLIVGTVVSVVLGVSFGVVPAVGVIFGAIGQQLADERWLSRRGSDGSSAEHVDHDD